MDTLLLQVKNANSAMMLYTLTNNLFFLSKMLCQQNLKTTKIVLYHLIVVLFCFKIGFETITDGLNGAPLNLPKSMFTALVARVWKGRL